MIRAILWAQWRSMRSFSGRSAISSVTGALFYGFWLFAAFGAQAFLANPGNRALLPTVLSPALLFMILYWQVTPVITASLGASLDLKKLLVYPVPPARLFWIEVLLRVTTCVEMLLLLAGIGLGALRNPETGGIAAIPRVLFAAALFASFNLLLSAGVRAFLERLLLRRRMREAMGLLLVAISVAPQFLIRAHPDWNRYKSVLNPSVFFPWSAASSLFLNASLWLPAAVLTFATALAYGFGRWQFQASLRFDGESAAIQAPQERKRAGLLDRILRLPALPFPDPIAAIVEKEMLSLSRMAPVRMIFLAGSALGVVLWLPSMMKGGAERPGFVNENLFAFCAAYSVLMLGQVTYFNCFGFDRSAVQAWFSLPVSISRVLLGKNIAMGFLALLEMGLTLLVAITLRVPLTPLKVAEGLAVGAIAALYLISFGNIASTRFPRMLNPEKVNQGGASKVINLMLLLTLPVVLSPVALAYWARSVFDSETVFFGLLALAASAGCLLYWIAMESATAAALARREKILSEFSKGDGPISTS